jgi:hypothetical protein
MIEHLIWSGGKQMRLENNEERIRRIEITLAFMAGIFLGLSSQIGVSSQVIVASGAFLALIIALMGRP